MTVHQTLTTRIAGPLKDRFAAVPPWSPARIAGETVLAAVLAVTAGLFDAMADGPGLRTPFVVLGVAALSLARRVLPGTALIVSAGAVAALPAVTLLLPCVSWSAGSRIARLGRMAAAYGGALLLFAGSSAYEEVRADADLPLVTGALSTAAFLVLAILPGLAGRYRAQRRSLLDALRRTNEQLVREQALVARQARLLERGRIAQDMHDSLGHRLVLISVHAGALQVDPDLTERQREGVGILRDASVAAMEELRETVGILRESRDDPAPASHSAAGAGEAGAPPGAGHASAAESAPQQPGARALASIDELVASSRAAGATVDVHRSGPELALAPAAGHAAYRVTQEGLTNAHKHAPGAPISVGLRYESDTLIVEVVNGPPPTRTSAAPAVVSGGQGLTGLEERVRLVGGMVHTGRTADGGFRIAAMLPCATGPGEARPHPDDLPSDTFEHLTPVVPEAGMTAAQAVPRPEFGAILNRRQNLVLGCAGTAVVLLVSVVALAFWGVRALLDELSKATIPPDVYESVQPGDPEKDVQDQLPAEDSFLTADLHDMGPPKPKGATCRHFASDDPDDVSTVFRFCFRDGELVAKQRFTDGF
ncbi:histidine kinase [Streptomyces sp. NPDC005805]|uniref:sensor histidine kinase n=1 Tax=Streptomyces sp. NPDC005805 TaxID=3157068 RepID=UPI0033E1FBD2